MSRPLMDGGIVIPRGGAMIFGIDTASVAGNKNPNWAQAKAQGPLSFALLRASFGTTPDTTFARDWPRLREVGLVRGAYLFLRFPRAGKPAPDPAAQARTLIQVVGELGPGDLPPTVDVEFPGKGRSETGLGVDECLAGIGTAITVLTDHYGVAPIVYTSARVWREDLGNAAGDQIANLGESPLWLARYFFASGKPAARDAAAFADGALTPAVPPPWGDADNWWIHQYQGDAVDLPGFPSGNVDMNRFNPMIKGARGDRVRWVQRRLGIAVNGRFDPAMETAVRKFQARQGLVPDAVIGPRSFAQLAWTGV
jgi:GH25 family lysozyme M1 (1,4-beta-N-acetylmuramidase)